MWAPVSAFIAVAITGLLSRGSVTHKIVPDRRKTVRETGEDSSNPYVLHTYTYHCHGEHDKAPQPFREASLADINEIEHE